MPKINKCKICKQPASVKVPAGHFCSVQHVYEHARKLQEQVKKRKELKAKREHAKRKESLKSRAEWLKEAQAEFNKFIRLRDEKDPCISCGKANDGSHQRHASHYKSRGAFPELAFNEFNCHASCAQCNNFLSGNLVPYRAALIDKIGLDKVEWLEGQHEPLKLTIEEIKELKAKYKAKCKAWSDH